MTITVAWYVLLAWSFVCVFVGMLVVSVRALDTENKLRAQIASLYKQLTDEETQHRAMRNL